MKTLGLISILLFSASANAYTETNQGTVVSIERNFGKFSSADCEASLTENNGKYICTVDPAPAVTGYVDIKSMSDKISKIDGSMLLVISTLTGYKAVLHKDNFSAIPFAKNKAEAIDLIRAHISTNGLDQNDLITVYHTVQ